MDYSVTLFHSIIIDWNFLIGDLKVNILSLGNFQHII